jgi:hypothetical protein
MEKTQSSSHVSFTFYACSQSDKFMPLLYGICTILVVLHAAVDFRFYLVFTQNKIIIITKPKVFIILN